MGSRQVVRHVALDHAFGGSNPPSPAMFAYTGGNGAGCHATCTVSYLLDQRRIDLLTPIRCLGKSLAVHIGLLAACSLTERE
jgi:hypothetical protein